MKKILVICSIVIIVFLTSCVGETTTVTTTQTTSSTSTAYTTTQESTSQVSTSVAEYIVGLVNEYNISLFVTEDLTTSMNINFEMPIDTIAYVEYAVLGTDFTIQLEATQKIRYFDEEPVYLYEATMDNLTPGETYEYRVVSQGLGETSEYYTFTTLIDTDTSHTIMFLADPQENTENGYLAYAFAVYNAMQAADVNFDLVMSPGDLVQDEDERAEWNWFFQYSSLFSTNKPLAATLGNHEMKVVNAEYINSLEFDGYLNLPNNGPIYGSFEELFSDQRASNFDDGKTYSFDYGLAHITVIDTEVYCDGSTTCTLYDHNNAEILNDWVSNDLANSDALWNIVMLHRGPYGLSYNTSAVRDNLAPIFDEYNVDLVLAGHEHQYSRAVYTNDEMVVFARSDDYSLGTISLIPENVNDLDFNYYSSSVGVTYFTPNTSSTKFYGGEKSSEIEVNYAFVDDYPVIPFITISEDSIYIVSYAMVKAIAYNILVDSVEVLEEFTITK